MSKKTIYNFNVQIEREVEESTTTKKKNQETGKMEEIVTTKKVVKPVDYGICIYEPSRRQVEDADMEFSIEMSRCIKRGILTKAMLAKKYSDSGGLLTEDDSSRLVRNYGKLGEMQNDLGRLMAKKKKTEEEKKQEIKLTEEYADLRKDIISLETSYQSVFNHTADTKAQNKTILWYLINLTFVVDPAGNEKPMFEGEDYDEKLDDYYLKDEKGSEVYDLAKEKLMAFISFWYFSQNPSEEDFKSLEKDIEEGNV
jgi:hypothetical protein